MRVGRRTGSRILIADGKHVFSDVWTSVGLLLGVLVMWLMPAGPAMIWIDTGIALILAVMLAMSGLRLMRQALGGIMDEADPVLLAKVVAAINEIRHPDWHDVHNLRLRRSGDLIFVEFHLVVPAQWTISQGHDASETLEVHVLKRLETRGSVMIHLDHLDHVESAAVQDRGTGQPPRLFTVEEATRFLAPELVK
jgi:cation diffusion facilitator family transporter